LLLFGGRLRVDHALGQVEVGGWMRFKCPAEVGVLFKELQAEFDRLLLAKVGGGRSARLP
jgi:hypothetical protein